MQSDTRAKAFVDPGVPKACVAQKLNIVLRECLRECIRSRSFKKKAQYVFDIRS